MTEKPLTLPIVDTLPAELLVLIGEIAVAWSVQELALRRIVFAMLNLSEPRGRLAVRTPRAKEMVELIADLALTEGVTVDMRGLATIDELENRRNKLMHGIWYDAGGGKYLLQEINGKIAVDAKDASGRKVKAKVNKRIIPAGVPINVDTLKDLLSAIRTVTLNTYSVAQALQGRREALQRIHHEPSQSEGSPGHS